VELMGGIEQATNYMLDAIDAGKSVVTANKAALAISAKTIFDAARSRGKDVGFEASVAGKIPIMALLRHFDGEEVRSITGILNGTSNFILTKMLREEMSYESALKMAQERGFAEKDPTRDVKGEDAADKIVLLASVAYNTMFNRGRIRPMGIDIVTLGEMQEAAKAGYSIKSIAQAVRHASGEVEITIGPKHVRLNNPLAHVANEYNGITIDTLSGDPITIQGPGAGRDATTSAVMADIRRIKRNLEEGTTDDLPTLDANVPLRI
jgi:homoserine dehydrogenase